MGVLIYFTIAVVVFYVQWRLNAQEFYDQGCHKNSSGMVDRDNPDYHDWVSRVVFWKITAVTVFWLFSIPILILWRILDRVNKKYSLFIAVDKKNKVLEEGSEEERDRVYANWKRRQRY